MRKFDITFIAHDTYERDQKITDIKELRELFRDGKGIVSYNMHLSNSKVAIETLHLRGSVTIRVNADDMLSFLLRSDVMLTNFYFDKHEEVKEKSDAFLDCSGF